MAEGDRADQGQPEPGPAGATAGRAGPEPLEDVVDFGGHDALPGVLDDQAGGLGIIVLPDREPDRVAGAGVLHGVLQQGVQGQPQALVVGGHGHRVQPPGGPDPACRRLPAPQRLHQEAVQRDRRQVEEFGVLGRGDQEQALAQALQPRQLADHHVDVLLLATAGQFGRQQLGVPQSDGDRRPELVCGVLKERALASQQLAGLLTGPVASGRCGPAAVAVPHQAKAGGQNEA